MISLPNRWLGSGRHVKHDLWCEAVYSRSQGAGGGLVVAYAEKASLMGSQFDSKQCIEQFVTPLS